MRILVFGAGAMGSFFGGLLSPRNDVTLVGRVDHMRAVRERGLRIIGKTAKIARPQTAIRVTTGMHPDLVIVATKAYDTGDAMRSLMPFASSAMFLTLQNGLGNSARIAKTAKRVAAGTTAHGVTYLGPGEIRHAGVGDTVLGPWRGVSRGDVVRLRDVFEDSGIPTRVTDDVRTELWSKVIVNAGINPLAAIAGVPNGRVVRDRRLLRVVEGVCHEASAVAASEGANLDTANIVRRTILTARRTATNRSSMLQDLDRGRRTEIEAITGAIVDAARRHEIRVPLNECLLALVKAREGMLRSPA
ncbi:MAG: hypothetical protein A3K68_02345 [Euryarchaeota archaeon RBG_16_68_13]|nr:MAG: hypothetical protein A3K68_02345 [Euryarchaeota archaeon RBG_16_68_13]